MLKNAALVDDHDPLAAPEEAPRANETTGDSLLKDKRMTTDDGVPPYESRGDVNLTNGSSGVRQGTLYRLKENAIPLGVTISDLNVCPDPGPAGETDNITEDRPAACRELAKFPNSPKSLNDISYPSNYQSTRDHCRRQVLPK
ncbi:hypothetical protein SAMD00023353_0201410 [Rosellinia necatrix]|uniref:Uncharacterized protein n=1 Tax=Rosellinia necatrix TaxID=77044 RepID=A0A1S8A4W2_ROSNE|nr:hypothetical protein SAMD00023353_0201410 [Rosellinia necatrix]